MGTLDATDRYLRHPGGPAEFDRLRAGRNVWVCLRCYRSTEVDPRRPGNCPHCGTPFWSTFTDSNGPDMPPYMKTYHTSDPSVSVADRDVIVRREGGGWRWFIVRTIDGYPIAKGQPHGRAEDAEADFHTLFEAFSNGIIKPDIDRSLKEMAGTTVAKVDPRTRQIATLRDMFDKSKSQIEAALPRHIRADYMLRVAMTSIQINPDLLKCEPKSVLSCVMQCSQLGLVPDGVMGEAYLVPFRDRKAGVMRCTLIPGYRGLQELARRSGYVTKIFARAVYAHDKFRYEEGISPTLEHVPATGERGMTVGYYAVAHFRERETDPQFVYMSREDIEAHRKRFATSNAGPWSTDFDAMAKKTVIRKLCNELPKARELQNLHAALEAEEKSATDVEWTVLDETPVALEDAHGKPQEEAGASAPKNGNGHKQQTEAVDATPHGETAEDEQPSDEGSATEAATVAASDSPTQEGKPVRRTEADAFGYFETALGRCGTMTQVNDLLAELNGEYAWLSPGTQDRLREKAAEIKGFIRAAEQERE